MSRNREASELPILGLVFLLLGLIFMYQGTHLFDSKTSVWISGVGNIGIFSIDQPLYYAITGSAFILSGSLLIGLQGIGKKHPTPDPIILGWVFIILAIWSLIQGHAMFDTFTYIGGDRIDYTRAPNFEQPIFFAITGGAFILSSSLLLGLDKLSVSLDNHS